MVDSINALILSDNKVTIEDISEKKQTVIAMGSAHKIAHDNLAFSKDGCHSFSSGQVKASYNCKNSECHQSICLGTAATSSSGFRSIPSDVHVCGPLKEFLRMTKFSNDSEEKRSLKRG